MEQTADAETVKSFTTQNNALSTGSSPLRLDKHRKSEQVRPSDNRSIITKEIDSIQNPLIKCLKIKKNCNFSEGLSPIPAHGSN